MVAENSHDGPRRTGLARRGPANCLPADLDEDGRRLEVDAYLDLDLVRAAGRALRVGEGGGDRSREDRGLDVSREARRRARRVLRQLDQLSHGRDEGARLVRTGHG